MSQDYNQAVIEEPKAEDWLCDAWDDNAEAFYGTPDPDSSIPPAYPTRNYHWIDRVGDQLGPLNLSYLSNANKSYHKMDKQLAPKILKIIKATMGMILENVVGAILHKACIGCEVDHPSQTRHSCLEPPEYFFEAHYDDIVATVLTPRLKHVLVKALNASGFHTPMTDVHEAAENFLHKLKLEPNITQRLSENRDEYMDKFNEDVVCDAAGSWCDESKESVV